MTGAVPDAAFGLAVQDVAPDIQALLNPLLEISSDEEQTPAVKAVETDDVEIAAPPQGLSTAPTPTRKRAAPSASASGQSSAAFGGPAKKAAPPRKRAKRPPVPSFMFQAPEPPAAEPRNKSEVDVFVTFAGRPGKGGSTTKPTSIEELERMVPVSFVPDVVPEPFADHMLRVFLEEAKSWHKTKRWLYEREIESHRVESGFRFNDFGSAVSSSGGFSQRWERAGFGDDLRHLRKQVANAVQRARTELRQRWRQKVTGRAGLGSSTADVPLTKHELAQETVALASRGQRLNAQSIEWLVRYAQSYATKSWRWEPNFVVANLYKDEDDFLGAHSDPVDVIGPFAIIASLTFGAARQFRMKPTGTVRFGEGRITSFSVRLPHNSLLVCWEGFQEFWRHEVPKDNGLKIHAIGGRSRLNFTFRKSVGSVSARRPVCNCGRKADLKPVLKETSKNRGRYFWSCTNPRVKKGVYRTCDFFKWDDELLQEPAAPRPATASTAPDASSRLVSVQSPT